MSMFSSVHLLSSSPTSLEKCKVKHLVTIFANSAYHWSKSDVTVSSFEAKPLCTQHSPVLEEAESLMGPDADEPLNRESLKWPKGLEDAPHPAGHLSGRVDVMGLCVLGETLLRGN